MKQDKDNKELDWHELLDWNIDMLKHLAKLKEKNLMTLKDIKKDKDAWAEFCEDVYNFVEVCRFNNRTPEENLALLNRDNPDTEDIEYHTLVMTQAKSILSGKKTLISMDRD